MYKAPTYKRGKMKGEGNEKKEKRPARVVSETEEGTNIKVFVSDGERSSVMECIA